MQSNNILNEYQALINKISGVISSTFITNNENEITELHVLANCSRSPKQISRDIQSALLAKFGYSIDYKLISIAQIPDNSTSNSHFRLVLKNIQVMSDRGRLEARVVLSHNEEEFEGVAIGGNTPSSRYRLVADAVLGAVHHFLNEQYIFILADVVFFSIAGKRACGVAVSHLSNSGEEYLIGSSFVKQDENESIVKATLDAINRKLNRCI